jgi:hypothetical protein
MKPRSPERRSNSFARVRTLGLTLPDVESATRYDGAAVLKVGGAFMAGMAKHRSAEPETLVVRIEFEERAWLLEDAPDAYYVTDYYRGYPVVLVRLSRVDDGALRDLLAMARGFTLSKTRRRGGSRQRSG